MAWIVGRESVEHTTHLPCVIHDTGQIGAHDFLAIALSQHGPFDALLDEVILHRVFVFEIDLGLAPGDFVKRWLRDVEMSVLDQLRHLAVEEGEQQSPDVCAVHIRVRHDNDLMVAQLGYVEFVTANARPERHHEVANFLTAEHPVKAGAFDVQDFTFQRQDRLRPPIATGLSRTTGAVTLNEEDFGL